MALGLRLRRFGVPGDSGLPSASSGPWLRARPSADSGEFADAGFRLLGI